MLVPLRQLVNRRPNQVQSDRAKAAAIGASKVTRVAPADLDEAGMVRWGAVKEAFLDGGFPAQSAVVITAGAVGGEARLQRNFTRGCNRFVAVNIIRKGCRLAAEDRASFDASVRAGKFYALNPGR